MARSSSPTARRRRLATALRQLREARKLSCMEVGETVGWSESKVSRIETGRTGIRSDDLDRLLDAYGVDEPTRTALHSVRRQASHRGWWSTYGDALPSWFQGYVGLEDGAKSVMVYQGQLVPGLLQTDDYATAVMRAHQPSVASDEIERQLSARAARQALLTRSEPLELWTVLDEAVLHRVVGGREVMTAQLHRLRELAALPNVTLQVLPYTHGAHAAMGTSFIQMKFPEAGDTDIIYIEDLTTSQYLEKPADIERYRLVADHLRASALPPEASVSFLKRVADAMS